MPPLTSANMEARRWRVSASEVAALMPEGHPYTTINDIWSRLYFGVDWSGTPNDAMTLGTILEPAILKAASAIYGLKVITNSHTYLHPTAPLCATPDARIIGERALVEIKYSGNPAAWVTLPAHVYYQVQAQMMCTGAQRVEVIVLAGKMKRFTVPRSKLAGRRIATACRDLQRLVDAGTPPPTFVRPAFSINLHPRDIPQSMIEGASS